MNLSLLRTRALGLEFEDFGTIEGDSIAFKLKAKIGYADDYLVCFLRESFGGEVYSGRWTKLYLSPNQIHLFKLSDWNSYPRQIELKAAYRSGLIVSSYRISSD